MTLRVRDLKKVLSELPDNMRIVEGDTYGHDGHGEVTYSELWEDALNLDVRSSEGVFSMFVDTMAEVTSEDDKIQLSDIEKVLVLTQANESMEDKSGIDDTFKNVRNYYDSFSMPQRLAIEVQTRDAKRKSSEKGKIKKIKALKAELAKLEANN